MDEELELVGPGGESQSVKRIRREGAHWVYELLVPRIGAKPGPVFAKAADPLSAPAEELSRHLKVAFPDFFAHVGAFSIPPQMYTVKGLAKELAIAVHYPHQWKLTVSLPPFRSYKAGYAMSKNRKRSKNETQPKDLDQRHKDATEVSFELDGWKIKNNYLRDGRVETIREKEESTSYRSSAHSALVAQAGLVMGDRGYELDYAKASEEDPIAITLNKVLVDCNPVKTVGQVVSTASKLADLITSIKEHVPKVGWYIDFEHKLFEGELSVEWGFKEHSDERVYPWLRFNIGMVFFAASIEVGIGVSWGSCRAQLFFKVAGQLGLEASGERVSPDGETGVSLGPLAAEFTTTLGVRLEAGHMLELNARGETGLLAEVTLHFNKNERAVSVDGQLSWKGLTVTATVSVCYGAWTKTVIKPLLDPRNLDFSLPNDDDYQAERIDDAEIQKIISDALTRGWNIEVDDIPMATTSAAIKERIVNHHPQIRRDRDSIRALAIDIDNRLSDMTDWGNDLTKQQFLDFVRRGELDQMCKEMYDPVLSFIATHKK